MHIVTVFVVLLLGALIGVGFATAIQQAEPKMNTICNEFESQTKIVDSYIDGEKVPLEITEHVCTNWEMEK